MVSAKTYAINTKDTIIEVLTKKIKNTEHNTIEKGDLLYQLADYYGKQNKADLAYKNYNLAKKMYSNLNIKDKEMECNLSLFSLLDSQNELNVNPLPYLESYYNYHKNANNTSNILKAELAYASYFFDSINYNKSKSYYEKALLTATQKNDNFSKAKINTNLGLLYSGFIEQDSARLFFDKALKLYNPKHSNQIFATYLNYANSYQKNKNYENAIIYLKKAETINLTEHKDNYEKILFSKLANCYKQIGDYKNAHLYLKKYTKTIDKLNITSQNIEITKIKEQYDNEKLRADNLEIENNRAKTQNIAVGLAGSLALGSVIAFLLVRDTKRKQKLAEQDKELQTQKLTTVLKEQELVTIDAMIEGQEKERQRIANDLHDDLGGLMATVKLHFNILKQDQTPELFNKTNGLIDEAYKKIRSIAHSKNSGVIAKQGLLKAVKEMAKKISISNALTIEVIDYGLDNRLENSLELTIFRIIQELLTNVIKHAEATQVTIHITNHEESLNIMVEDNGKGFNPSQVTKTNKGMGISSIDKRVEHLNGKLTIESEKHQGTSIIIDIPL